MISKTKCVFTKFQKNILSTAYLKFEKMQNNHMLQMEWKYKEMHGNDKQIEGNVCTWVKREGDMSGKVCVKGLQICTYVYCLFFFK